MKFVFKEIFEKEVWDGLVKRWENGHLFQSFAWGEFKKTQGWSVRRLALEGAALSILEKKTPLGGLKFWYLPRGPVLDYRKKELVNRVLEFLINFGRQNKVTAVKISPEVVLSGETEWLLEFLKNKGFKETADYQLHRCTLRIDLTRDLKDVLAQFKKNTRWEIRKAEKDGVAIKTGENENDLKTFYSLYAEAMGRDRLAYRYFKNFWQVFKPNLLILIAFYQGRPVSAVLIPFFNQKCWYLFGGSSKKYPTRNSSQLLQWEAVKRAKERGAQVYDLQGIPCRDPQTPHEKGIVQFKEGFGGKRVELIGEFDYVFSPIWYAVLRKLNQARIITRGIMGRV